LKILNIAGGKSTPILDEHESNIPNYTLHVDTSYFSKDDAYYIETDMTGWLAQKRASTIDRYLSMDIFEFMERTRLKFDRITIYRYLEHVSFTQVEYFIYLVSTVLEKGGIVDIIVPNYKILAEMILNEDNYTANKDFTFEPWNILLTTELLNEPSCPHASIWTTERLRKFWRLEGRFVVRSINPVYKFDGRDIYLRGQFERV